MWKRFNFFDKGLLAGPVLSKDDKALIQEQMRREDGSRMQDVELSTGEEPEGPYRLLQAFDVICTGFARGRFFAGCHGGAAGMIENSGEPFRRWRAHVLRVTHILPMAGSDVVATFGDGQDWRDTDVRSARRASVAAARKHLASKGAWPPHGGPDGAGQDVSEAGSGPPGSVTADLEPMSAAVEAALARTAEVRPSLRLWRLPAAETSSAPSATAASAGLGAGSSGSAAHGAAAAWPPTLLRDIPLDVDPDLCPAVTAVAVASDLLSAAVGLANGAVILIRGDLSRARGGPLSQVTILPPSAHFEAPAERRGAAHTGRAVTGLYFCRHSEASLDEPVPPGMADADDGSAGISAGAQRIQVLYVVTEQRGWAFFPGDVLPQSLRRVPTVAQLLRRRSLERSPPASAAIEDGSADDGSADGAASGGKGAARAFRATPSAGGPRVLVSEEGASAGCSCVAENGVLVMAGDAGIAPVTPQARGPFFSLAGQKQGVSWARGRLVVVTSSGERQAVSVLDIRNQLAVLTMPLPLMQAHTAAAVMGAGGGAVTGARPAPRTHAVTDLLWGWTGSLLVVTTEGAVHCLWERSTADKLAALRAARRFDIAVRLARSSADFGPAAVAAIVREQGDVAYAEGRFREAAQRFAETIGFVEPSYVVRRFLAAPQTSNLVLYLEALHEKGHASAEHTTLLINCYTRAAAAAAAASGSAEAEAELSDSDGGGGGGSDSSDSGGSDDDDYGYEGEEEEEEEELDGRGGGRGGSEGGDAAAGKGRAGRGKPLSRRAGRRGGRRGGRDAGADADGDAFRGSASARKVRVLAKLRTFIRSAKAEPLEEEADAEAEGAGAAGRRRGGGAAGAGSEDDDDEDEEEEEAARRRRSGQGSLDVSRAITELSQAGLPEFAAFALNLAVRSHRHEAAVGLWAGQLGDASAALRYLRALPHSVAERVTLRWGAKLLRAMPSDTADVIRELCTGWVPDVAAAAEAALAALDGDSTDLATWRVRSEAACAAEARLQGGRDTRAPSTVKSHVGRFLPLFELPPEGGMAPPDVAALPDRDAGSAGAGAASAAGIGAGAAGIGASTPDLPTAVNAALLSGSADSRLRRLLDAQLRRLLSAVAASASAPALSPAAALALLELCLRPDVADPETHMLVPVRPPAAATAYSSQKTVLAKAKAGGAAAGAAAGAANSVAPASSSGAAGAASTSLWRWVPRPGKGSTGSSSAALSRRVLAGVLENTSRCPVDSDAALAMCRRYGFEVGSLRLMARAGSSGVRAAMERHVSLMEGATSARRWDDVVSARQALLDHCAAHQASDGSLWGEAMVAIVRSFVGRAETADSGAAAGAGAGAGGDRDAGGTRGVGAGTVFLTGTDAEDEEEALSQCVEAAVAVGGMAPLQAVEILSQNGQVPLRVVKPLLERALGETERAAVEAEAATRAHRAETQVMRAELRQLRGPGVPFVAERSRFTGAELDGPSVHFLCGRVLAGRRLTADVDKEHSFLRGEVDAFGDELVCPVCHADHMHTLELRRQVAAAARDKARFFAVLDDPEERGGQFAAVAEFLGKGVVEPLTADLAPLPRL